MKYYKIICQRGHVGTNHTAYITFYFKARDLLTAVSRAQKMGGVHHSKPPVLCKEVTEAEYKHQLKSGYNAYASCCAKKA